jgi:hypothetical protein
MAQCFIGVFPSLALLRQFYESHIEKTKPVLRECQEKALVACAQEKPVVNISMCTGAGKSRVISECLPANGTVEYYATDGTLPDVLRITSSAPGDVILTTYISAPLVFRILSELGVSRNVHVIHDEAHHITSPIYKENYDASVSAGLIQKTINFSATLPEGYECDYTYPLLRGIKDGVVRDFYIKAIACLSGDSESSFVDIVNLALEWARSQGQTLRLLVYTSEANTDNAVETEGGTSVRSFLEYFGEVARVNGWWMRGLHNDTMGDREEILREFEDTNPASGVAILVSCRTLSEGVDLRNANAMLPWDPSSDAKTNIQRIGRVVRKYKDVCGEYLPPEQQTPSLVIVPVWLERDTYLSIKGDSTKIHEQLYKDIENGMRGSFAPLLNVTAALKSELTLEDEELFREVINFPSRPKSGTMTGNVIEVVARSLKKKPKDVVAEMGECDVLDDDTKEALGEWVSGGKAERESLWEDIPEDVHGDVLDALVASQDLTLLVEQEKGGEPEVFGNGNIQKTLERKPDGTYAISRRKRETPAEKKAKKEVQKRVSLCATGSCRVVLGLEEGAFEDGKSLVRLTTRIEFEGESHYVWNKRFEQWKAFAEKKGDTPLSSAIDEHGNKVGSWQNDQRYAYKRKYLLEERKHILNEQPYWKWEREDMWFANYYKWKMFTDKNDRRPLESDHMEKRLSRWESKTRNKKTKLSSDKICILESSKHWTWNPHDDKWNFMLNAYINFCDKHNRIPINCEKDEFGNSVGRWQNKQREKKDKYMKTNIERYTKLDKIGFWSYKTNDIIWNSSFQTYCNFCDKHNRIPIDHEKDEFGNPVGRWQNKQRTKKDKYMKTNIERYNILSSYKFWRWSGNIWNTRYEQWRAFTETHKRLPKYSEKDEFGNTVGSWQTTQRNFYRKKNKRLTKERIDILNSHPLWSWESPPRAITRTNKSPKSKSSTIPTQHTASQLEIYHKKYKSMNSATYFSHIKESPSDWEEYHKIADEYDKRDAPEHSPHHRITSFIQSRHLPAGTPAIDLGCGRDRLRDDSRVSHLDWTSVDAVPSSERVVQADLGSLPMSDNTYQLAVISRALWARKPDHMTQLREAARILRPGGMLVLCESRRKWVEEKTGGDDSENPRTTLVNHLELDVQDAGFVITAKSKNDDKSVWQFLVCQKPMVGGI